MWKAFIDRVEYSQRGRLFLVDERPDGSSAVATKIVFKTIETGSFLQEDDALLSVREGELKQLLQSIVDAAWDAFRIQPSDAGRSTNAKDAHLADMRALVAKLAKTTLP